MKKLNFLLVSMICLQQSIVAGPAVSKAIDDSLHKIDFLIAYYIEQKNDLLLTAVLVDNKKAINYVLSQNNRNLLNYCDQNGDTALHYAAQVGSVSTVDLLVKAGVDKSKINKDGVTAWKLAQDLNQSSELIRKLSPQIIGKKKLRHTRQQSNATCF